MNKEAEKVIAALERDERICEVVMILSVLVGIIILIFGGLNVA